MDAESFNDLALRVLAGEATDTERRALETELSDAPARREEFEQLRLAYKISQTVTAAQTTEPELPAYRMNELRTAVRQHFGRARDSYRQPEPFRVLFPALRWIFAGGGITALAAFVVFLSLSDRAVEVGFYQTDQVRGGETPLTASDVPSARIVTFDQDASFDQWQSQPLAWNEHAKLWVDNEHDVLNIIHRDNQGKIIRESQPLAPTDAAQREQIQKAVESLKK